MWVTAIEKFMTTQNYFWRNSYSIIIVRQACYAVKRSINLICYCKMAANVKHLIIDMKLENNSFCKLNIIVEITSVKVIQHTLTPP